MRLKQSSAVPSAIQDPSRPHLCRISNSSTSADRSPHTAKHPRQPWHRQHGIPASSASCCWGTAGRSVRGKGQAVLLGGASTWLDSSAIWCCSEMHPQPLCHRMSKAFDCHQSNLNGRSPAVGCAFGALQPAASPHREHDSKGLPTAWQLWLRVRHSVKVHNERWIWLHVTRTRSCSDQRRVTGRNL